MNFYFMHPNFTLAILHVHSVAALKAKLSLRMRRNFVLITVEKSSGLFGCSLLITPIKMQKEPYSSS